MSRIRPSIVLAAGYLSMFLLPAFMGIWIFHPHWSVPLAYLLVAVTGLLCREQDYKSVLVASWLLVGLGLLAYFWAYANWSILGLVMSYHMPLVILAISLPVTVVFLGRKVRKGGRQGNAYPDDAPE